MPGSAVFMVNLLPVRLTLSSTRFLRRVFCFCLSQMCAHFIILLFVFVRFDRCASCRPQQAPRRLATAKLCEVPRKTHLQHAVVAQSPLKIGAVCCFPLQDKSSPLTAAGDHVVAAARQALQLSLLTNCAPLAFFCDTLQPLRLNWRPVQQPQCRFVFLVLRFIP